MANKAFVVLSQKYPGITKALEISFIQKIDSADFLATIKRIPSGWKKTSFPYSVNKFSIYPVNSLLDSQPELQTQFRTSFLTLNNDKKDVKTAFEYDKNWILVIDEKEENVSFFLIASQKVSLITESERSVSLAPFLFYLVTGSPKFYTPSFQRKIAGEINTLLGSNLVSGRIDLSKVTNLSTLTFNDLKYGGLISGQGEEFYSVTYKPDGTRVFVYITHEGIFLLGTTSFLWISDNIIAYPSNGKVSENNLPILLEGEFVPRENRRNNGVTFVEKYLIEVYDCLIFSGKPIVTLPLYERLEWRDHFISLIDRKVKQDIRIVIKKHWSFKNSSQFYEIMQGLFANLETFPNYQTDGFVFTPSGEYLGSKLFKWKPLEQNTIDVLYKENKWFQKGEKNELIELKLEVEGAFKEGIIYELQPGKDNVWSVYRERTNRRFPNSIQQIQSIMKTIRDPILETTLIGQDLELFKRFHRRMKGILLSYASGKLLDIGSGRLGDLVRWEARAFRKVYALEPSEEYNLEGKRRLEGHKGVEVIQIQGNGEDEIDIEQVDNISMMFSLSFFGEKNKLRKLLKNIDSLLKPGGLLLLAVFEGDLLESAFNNWPKLVDPEIKEEALVFPAGAEVRILHNFSSQNTYGFDIETTLEGTIVGKQQESPVFMRKLLPLLEKIGIKPIKTWIFDQETFLNPVELYLTRLFSGWIFRREGTSHEISVPKPISETKVSKAKISKPRVKPKITTCQILPIGKIEKLSDLFGYPIQRIGVPSDGSCLIHSILSSADDEYQQLDKNGKNERAVAFREQLTEDLTEERFNKLHVSQIGITNLGKNEEDGYSYNWFLRRIGNPSVYLGSEDIQYLSEYFEINIIFFRCKEGTNPAELEEYKMAQDVSYNKKWIFIMILWVSGNHFEPLSIDLGKGFATYVKAKHPFMKNFL